MRPGCSTGTCRTALPLCVASLVCRPCDRRPWALIELCCGFGVRLGMPDCALVILLACTWICRSSRHRIAHQRCRDLWRCVEEMPKCSEHVTRQLHRQDLAKHKAEGSVRDDISTGSRQHIRAAPSTTRALPQSAACLSQRNQAWPSGMGSEWANQRSPVGPYLC